MTGAFNMPPGASPRDIPGNDDGKARCDICGKVFTSGYVVDGQSLVCKACMPAPPRMTPKRPKDD